MTVGTHTILQSAFKGMDEGTLEQLRQVAKTQCYAAGEVICRQGEAGDTFYVIREGHVAVTQQLEDGQQRLLSVLGPRRYFGEMALIDNTPRMATCTAVTEVATLLINEEIFDQLIETSPQLAYHITTRVLELLRNMEQLAIQDLTQKNQELREAYAELKAAQAELVVKERLVRELELAAETQRRLLPDKLPQFPNYQFAAFLKPARQVGGDFYDVIHLDDDHVGVLIADVADKGFHAALFMAVTYTLFRSSCYDSLSPASVAVDVHRHILDAGTSDVFVTAVYGVLHLPSGRFTYVRAGHERPLLYRPHQPVQELPGNGRFLGMLLGLTLTEETITLQPGDKILLVSDGVPDATNAQGEQYGNERLMTALTKYGRSAAPDLIQHITTDIAAWQQDAPPFDDLTMLVLEVIT
ncbi:MAG: SpoIIE family protein phosphatase [Ardenticatenaceae bacterium]|nr:SpoIIE family protein phosphatase [Ardenticatenaceae bacterium]